MAEKFTPAYLKTGPDKVREKAVFLRRLSSPCRLCPRECTSLREKGETGYCKTGLLPIISSVGPHFGEEAPLVGKKGSGTVFLTNCNLGCIFCQNSDISHLGRGCVVTTADLARSLLDLQELGCHNINVVTPTHQIHAIVEAVSLAMKEGLTLPLVYNTGGYDALKTLRALEGIFDIYMPDLKFSERKTAAFLADAPDYPEVARNAILEMHRQVGDLTFNERGLAVRGLLVRHLVLPHDLAGSDEALRFLAQDISKNTYLNIMAQYRPCYRALGAPLIGSPLNQEDHRHALDLARKWGLERLD